jgi:hypothetical protein
MAEKIDGTGNSVINNIKLTDQASNPSTPAGGYALVFAKNDGLPYLINSTGTIVLMAGRQLISEKTPSGTGTVTFLSIPGLYKGLTLEWVARSTQAATHENMVIAFNTDTTDANYRYTRVYAYGPGTAGGSGDNGRVVCEVPAASAPSNSPSAGRLEINLYALTTFNKVANHINAYRRDDSSVFMLTEKGSIEWENAAAITRIDLSLAAGNFVAGSTFRLYGEY